jgi:hypothetical protein
MQLEHKRVVDATRGTHEVAAKTNATVDAFDRVRASA